METNSPDTPEVAAPKPQRQRRWLQFSLRTLLIVVALIAVAVGLLMRHVHELRAIVQREKEAVAEIEKLGGSVRYAVQTRLVCPDLPIWLRSILGDEEYRPVVFVSLINSKITHAGMKQISKLTALKYLYLSFTPITDKDLENLSKLTELEQLYLNDTQITDNGLQYLLKLTALRWVYTDNSQITYEGKAKLMENLPNYRRSRGGLTQVYSN